VELYNSFPTVHGVVHTHSTYAVAWAQALLPIPIFGTTHADQTVHDIPCTPLLEEEFITGNYEIETGRQILRHLSSLRLSEKDVEMILVGGHGPFVWGGSVEAALHNAIALEEIARMAYLTRTITTDANRLSDALRRKHYERKHGAGAYYGQTNAGKER
jgi:L-ribulose-5-phosphate 4-epimerase